jgi:hypothetical protein
MPSSGYVSCAVPIERFIGHPIVDARDLVQVKYGATEP